MYYSSSEFVSSGHPDRLADNIAAALIQKIQEKDGPKSHAAVEVFITKDKVIFGGEVTTTLEITYSLLRWCLIEGYLHSGYLPEMRKYWSKDQVALADDMYIVNELAHQSPDIALGTTDKGIDSGYNDQGVFFSSSDNTTENRIGFPMAVATEIGNTLTLMSLNSIGNPIDGVVLGPDNKVVATVRVKDDGFTPDGDACITAITIAVAHNDVKIKKIRELVQKEITEVLEMRFPGKLSPDCEWVINGTGKFVVHGAASDTSMTGRKISVNHPSAGPVWCNKMIGGGSLVKPWHASDFALNVLCRFMANVVVEAGLSDYAVVGCGCAIGQTKPQSLFVYSDSKYNEHISNFFKEQITLSPSGIATLFSFWSETFDFLSVVNTNFFGNPDTQPWEDKSLIKMYADKLNAYLFKA